MLSWLEKVSLSLPRAWDLVALSNNGMDIGEQDIV